MSVFLERNFRLALWASNDVRSGSTVGGLVMSKRYIWMITIGLFFCAVVVNAQTRGQVAEKERDRRASLGIEHAGELVTEVQLRSGREDEVDADLDTIVPEGEFPAREASVLSLALGDAAESVDADPWAEFYEGYQTAYRDAKAVLSDAEAFKGYCDEGSAPPEKPGIVGWYWTVDCASMPKEVAQAQQSVQDIQTACHDHARRLRIPPGRARLR